MDRTLDPTIRRRKRLRSLIAPGIAIAAAITLLVALPGWMSPKIQRGRLRTAVVDRGPIDATLTASGIVLPEYEHILASPIDTRVTRILKTAGDAVSPGDSIVVLDLGESRLAVGRLEDQIAIKENQRAAEALDLASKLDALRVQVDIKSLELRSADYAVTKSRKLFDKGLTSGDTVRQAETDAERKRIELAELETAKQHAEEASRLRLAGLRLEQRVLAKERDEAARCLELGTAISNRSGVLTWVVPSEGAAVHRGDEIARIADLRFYRVEGTVSDVHSTRLAVGQPALIQMGDESLTGRIAQILPAIQDGAITFHVTLDQRDDPRLRPNQRVDVQVATAHKDDVIRVKRGAFPAVNGRTIAFVVRDDRAVRTPVELGVASFDHLEILKGLAVGDEVILSDMADHAHLTEVGIR